MIDPAVRESEEPASSLSPSVATDAGPNRLLWRVFGWIATTVLVLVFVRSSTSHLTNPYYFLSSVYSYKIVGVVPGKVIALVLPAAQLVVAVCLTCRVAVPSALVLSSLLFAAFSIAQASALWRGLKIGCGCFGAAESRQVSMHTLGVSLFLLLMSVLLAWSSLQRLRPRDQLSDLGK